MRESKTVSRPVAGSDTAALWGRVVRRWQRELEIQSAVRAAVVAAARADAGE